MFEEGFEFFEGVVGVGPFDEFDFIELVEAVEAADVFAPGAGFASEAGGVGAVVDGEVFFVEGFVSVEVGYGDFCGWDGVEVIFGREVHLTFFIGELACSGGGIGVD